MAKKIAQIPLVNISKISIYVNTKKKSLSAIKKETGADYVINGGLYNSNWTPCPILKVDNKIISSVPYTAWGYGWNIGHDIEMTNKVGTYTNFITCTDLINPWDGKNAKLHYSSAQGKKRGRTAIGIANDTLILYCSKDGTLDAKTPESLRDEMVSLGCTTALMLDSGGSSQCNFKGQTIYSSRVVHNLILVYLNKSKITAKEPIGTYKVTALVGLNIRSGTSTKYSKVGKYKYGTIVDVYEISNGWGRTDTGWVSMTYLKEV